MSTARKQQRGKKDPMLNAQLLKRKARGSHCQQGKGNQRRSKLTITNPDAAGIDVGAQVHYAAVPEGRDQVSVRSFGAYTAQLDELVQWFKDCGIKTVAMESTGVSCQKTSPNTMSCGRHYCSLVERHEARARAVLIAVRGQLVALDQIGSEEGI